MRKSRVIFFLLIIFGCLVEQPAFSQLKITPFEQLDSLQKTGKRNVFVFIHTDWCRFCQSMKNTTFKDEKIIQLLNEKCWFVMLNAEEKQDIIFNGHTFRYKPTGYNTGIHELAEQLGTMNGKTAYPTSCILNTRNEIIFQYDQFLSAADLLKLLPAIPYN
jgi:thioredoxin-related protein